MATNLGNGGVVGKMTREQFAKHARAATPFDPVDGVEITGRNIERLQKAMKFLGWADPRFVTAAEAEKNGWAVMPDSSSVGIKVRDPVKGSYADVFLFNAENVVGMPGLAAMLAMTDEEIAKMQELGGVESEVEDELSIEPAREIVREVGTANLEENFLEWARDNYSGMEYEEILNHRIQSGEYPEAFLDVEDELSIEPAREIVREVGGQGVRDVDVVSVGDDNLKSYYAGHVRLENGSLLRVDFEAPLDATENVIQVEMDKAISEAIENKRLALQSGYGRLVGYGVAPYLHDPKNTSSYFAVVEDALGDKKTMWGVDIERSLEEAGVKVGDAVMLTRGGKEPVQIKEKQPDGSFIEKTVDRIKWDTRIQPIVVEQMVTANTVADATTAAIAGAVADDGRFAVMASYWQDGLHNAEGVALAAEINAAIKDRGLAEDKEAIERLLAIYPKARRLGIEVVPERVFLADPHLKANLAEPRFLLGGALVRGEDGAYRPYGGGLAVLVDKGDSLVLKSRDKDGYAAAMELAIAKGWTAIELKGKPAMLASAWLEARLKGLDVVNYEPTEKDMERYQERVAEESRARAKEAGVPEVEGAPGVAVEPDELVVAPGRTIEQGPEQVVYKSVVDADGQTKTAMVIYTVSQEVGVPETFDNPKDAARAFSRIDAAALPAVVRSVTRADGYVEADVQVAGTGMAKGKNKPVKSADAVLAHEFAEAFVAVKEEERVNNALGNPVANGVEFSGAVVGSGQDENGRSFVDQKVGRNPGNVIRHYLESGVKAPVNGAVMDIIRGRNGKAKIVEKGLEVEGDRELVR